MFVTFFNFLGLRFQTFAGKLFHNNAPLYKILPCTFSFKGLYCQNSGSLCNLVSSRQGYNRLILSLCLCINSNKCSSLHLNMNDKGRITIVQFLIYKYSSPKSTFYGYIRIAICPCSIISNPNIILSWPVYILHFLDKQIGMMTLTY